MYAVHVSVLILSIYLFTQPFPSASLRILNPLLSFSSLPFPLPPFPPFSPPYLSPSIHPDNSPLLRNHWTHHISQAVLIGS